MELIALAVLVGIAVGMVAIYRNDPAGWHATYQRAKSIVTSNINRNKPVEVRRQRNLDAAKKWDLEFSGESEKHQLDPQKRHSVVKRDFTGSGSWAKARAVCKCGASYSHYLDIYGIVGTKRVVLKGINEHVKEMNRIDAELSKGTGDFMW